MHIHEHIQLNDLIVETTHPIKFSFDQSLQWQAKGIITRVLSTRNKGMSDILSGSDRNYYVGCLLTLFVCYLRIAKLTLHCNT